MFKSLLKYILVFTLLFFGGSYLHSFFLEQIHKSISFSIEKIYLFHFIFSLLICVLFLLLTKSKKFKDQLGFLYLATLLLKLFFFLILFQNIVFSEVALLKIERISLLIPVILFLSFEVFYISKILKRL